MPSEEFAEFLSGVRDKLSSNSFPNETAVREMIVLPVLRHLGWNTYDPRYVYPEYPLDRLKVDYGLKISENEGEGLRCIIEVKAVGNLDADHQLFQYAFIAGAPLGVFTDGRQWRFYLVMTAGGVNERLVRTLDIEKHEPEEAVKALTGYLSFEKTCSGEAEENAKRDLSQKITREKTKGKIPGAWVKLTDGSSDKLVNLLIEETSQISAGYAPARADVEEFLASLSVPPKPPEKKPEKPRKPKTRQQKKGKEKGCSFFLFGEKYSEPNALRAYVRIMEILASRDRGFLARLAPKTASSAGKKYKWLSKNSADMSSYNRKRNEPLPGGWYLGLDRSPAEKRRRLKLACKIAEIPFGSSRGLELLF